MFDQHAADDLDTGLWRVFRDSRIPFPACTDVDRARSRVLARLHRHTPVAVAARRGRLSRSLAIGGAAAGALWAVAVRSALAHKTAAVVAGAGIVLGGGYAAEATGAVDALRAVAGFDGREERSHGEGPAAPWSATVERAPEGMPGNLVLNIRPGQRFHARTVVLAAGVDTLTLRLAGGGEATIAVAPDPRIHIPGPPTELTLSELLALLPGRLVVVEGECIGDAQSLDDPGCRLTRVTALGVGNSPSSGSLEGGKTPGGGVGRGQSNSRSDSASTPGPPEHSQGRGGKP